MINSSLHQNIIAAEGGWIVTMIFNQIGVGQIDIGIHPELPYLADLNLDLTRLDSEGRPCFPSKAYMGTCHGSLVASVLCGDYYEDLPRVREIKSIEIPALGKTVLCLLRALESMLEADIRVLCMPLGINLPTPVFRPFLKALLARGVLVVVPSGNKHKATILTPGFYPEVLTVGALKAAGNAGQMPEGTDPGLKPDLLARAEFPDPAEPDSGKTIRGSSMACAWVAGKAARLWQRSPESTLHQLLIELGAPVLPRVPDPPFLLKPYRDARLMTSLRLGNSDDRIEGIILSGFLEGKDPAPFPIEQLLREAEERAGCAPQEINTFRVAGAVHLCASSHFFEILLQHPALFCAQAVDVSMLDR